MFTCIMNLNGNFNLNKNTKNTVYKDSFFSFKQDNHCMTIKITFVNRKKLLKFRLYDDMIIFFTGDVSSQIRKVYALFSGFHTGINKMHCQQNSLGARNFVRHLQPQNLNQVKRQMQMKFVITVTVRHI